MNKPLTDKEIHDLLLKIKTKHGYLYSEEESMAMTKAIASFENE